MSAKKARSRQTGVSDLRDSIGGACRNIFAVCSPPPDFEGECDGSGGRGQTNRWQVGGLSVCGGGWRGAVVLGENFVKSRKGAQGPGAGRR